MQHLLQNFLSHSLSYNFVVASNSLYTLYKMHMATLQKKKFNAFIFLRNQFKVLDREQLLNNAEDLKRHKLLTEEKMSDRIAKACNNAIPAEILYNFTSYSKRQIIQCYNKTPF